MACFKETIHIPLSDFTFKRRNIWKVSRRHLNSSNRNVAALRHKLLSSAETQTNWSSVKTNTWTW